MGLRSHDYSVVIMIIYIRSPFTDSKGIVQDVTPTSTPTGSTIKTVCLPENKIKSAEAVV